MIGVRLLLLLLPLAEELSAIETIMKRPFRSNRPHLQHVRADRRGTGSDILTAHSTERTHDDLSRHRAVRRKTQSATHV